VDLETNSHRSFDGLSWSALDLSQVAKLGIQAAADDTNRLSVASDATLLSHDGGGHQLKLNKAAETDSSSVVFQTDFSGRAEIGTAGGENFSIKVSADGTTWTDALTVDGTVALTTFRGQSLDFGDEDASQITVQAPSFST